ncbi:uncharacterized protein F5147DRAFT_658159 [Suillus discolor]|uniref:Uncharacterized protein n=1 Tax=Suillus discolor TaxID=1912936 RepID=A0A9P7ETP1_9AGAM|nr:uncharacterized protein F5147DRAFT_658159 [Suillus discolor]KAG2090493.1 hypothetical protein F5147DRAFT_658159 [Suillus discolor]
MSSIWKTGATHTKAYQVADQDITKDRDFECDGDFDLEHNNQDESDGASKNNNQGPDDNCRKDEDSQIDQNQSMGQQRNEVDGFDNDLKDGMHDFDQGISSTEITGRVSLISSSFISHLVDPHLDVLLLLEYSIGLIGIQDLHVHALHQLVNTDINCLFSSSVFSISANPVLKLHMALLPDTLFVTNMEMLNNLHKKSWMLNSGGITRRRSKWIKLHADDICNNSQAFINQTETVVFLTASNIQLPF